jgi:hypothetical protein
MSQIIGQGSAADYAEQIRALAHGEIKPGRIVGSGYKDARQVAFIWLSNQLIKQMQEEN